MSRTNLFKSLGPAYFSPSTYPYLSALWTHHGGRILTPQDSNSDPLLLPVSYYFVKPNDPLIPHLLKRPIILFNPEWIYVCVSSGELVEIGNWVIDPPFIIQGGEDESKERRKKRDSLDEVEDGVIGSEENKMMICGPSSNCTLIENPTITNQANSLSHGSPQSRSDLCPKSLPSSGEAQTHGQDNIKIQDEYNDDQSPITIVLNAGDPSSDTQNIIIHNSGNQPITISISPNPSPLKSNGTGLTTDRTRSHHTSSVQSQRYMNSRKPSLQPQTDQMTGIYNLEEVLSLLRTNHRSINVEDELVQNDGVRWRVEKRLKEEEKIVELGNEDSAWEEEGTDGMQASKDVGDGGWRTRMKRQATDAGDPEDQLDGQEERGGLDQKKESRTKSRRKKRAMRW